MAIDTPTTADAIRAKQDALRECADMGDERLGRYALAEEYYNSEQRTQLTDRAKKYLEASGLRFCENFCETIVDVFCERLRVEGFRAGDDEDLAAWCGDVWQANRMDAKQDVVHTATVKKGDGFLIVDWDTDKARPRFSWNRPEIIKPVYPEDGTDEPEYVSKCWNAWDDTFGTVRRLNIYFPDRVEKYFTYSKDDESHWMPYVGDEDYLDGQAVWPTPWTRPDGSPRGIPVFHFRHKAQGAAFGRSRLLSVVPFQDAVNKQAIDLFWVLDAHGWRQPWVSGEGADTIDIKTAPGEWLKLSGESMQIGQLDASDVKQITDGIESTLRRMASKSETPLHLLMMGGTLPSGESLKTAEAPIVHSIKREHYPLGNTWEDAMQMAVRLENDYGTGGLDEDVVIETVWDDPASRNELGEAQAAQAWHDIGVSAHTLMSRAGFDPDEEVEKREDENAKAFDRGQMFGLPPGPAPTPEGSTVPDVEQ